MPRIRIDLIVLLFPLQGGCGHTGGRHTDGRRRALRQPLLRPELLHSDHHGRGETEDRALLETSNPAGVNRRREHKHLVRERERESIYIHIIHADHHGRRQAQDRALLETSHPNGVNRRREHKHPLCVREREHIHIYNTRGSSWPGGNRGLFSTRNEPSYRCESIYI